MAMGDALSDCAARIRETLEWWNELYPGDYAQGTEDGDRIQALLVELDSFRAHLDHPNSTESQRTWFPQAEVKAAMSKLGNKLPPAEMEIALHKLMLKKPN